MFWYALIAYLMIQSASIKLSTPTAGLFDFYFWFFLLNLFVACICSQEIRKHGFKIQPAIIGLSLIISALLNAWVGVCVEMTSFIPVFLGSMIKDIYMYSCGGLTIIEILIFIWWGYDTNKNILTSPIAPFNSSVNK